MTTLPIKSFRKAVVERRRLYLDYDCWLAEDEKLSTLQVLVSPYTDTAPLVVDTGFTDAAQRKLMMFVSGGLANTGYILQMIVGTDAGQVKRDDLGIKVSS
jgi:hypothetical protein